MAAGWSKKMIAQCRQCNVHLVYIAPLRNSLNHPHKPAPDPPATKTRERNENLSVQPSALYATAGHNDLHAILRPLLWTLNYETSKCWAGGHNNMLNVWGLLPNVGL